MICAGLEESGMCVVVGGCDVCGGKGEDGMCVEVGGGWDVWMVGGWDVYGSGRSTYRHTLTCSCVQMTAK